MLNITRLLLFLAAALLPAASSARTVFVNQAAPTGGDGTSWPKAFQTIQDGVAAAKPGDEVWVARGTYAKTVQLRTNAALYGGFDGTETTLSKRHPNINTTTIKPLGSGTGIYISSRVGICTIDGFTLQTLGMGIYCSDGTATISHNRFVGTRGAILSRSPNSIYIRDNEFLYGIGGIYTYVIEGDSTMVDIENNLFEDNQSNVVRSFIADLLFVSSNVFRRNNGITIYGDACRRTVTVGNVIVGNLTGIICNSTEYTVKDNEVVGNGGSGISASGKAGLIYNNTIVDNNTTGRGAINLRMTNAVVSNNLVAFNGSGIFSSQSEVRLKNNCVYHNAVFDVQGLMNPIGNDGNFQADPLLVDYLHGNAHIQPNSPCRDVGADSAVSPGDLDVDGQTRQIGSHVDIGADESDGHFVAAHTLVIRVKPDGNDASDGSSWLKAKRTVQAALDATAGTGGEVWVSAGIYNENVHLQAFQSLYGGFTTKPSSRGTQRDWDKNVTVLDGGSRDTVVSVQGGYRDTAVDGFTIRHGASKPNGYSPPGGDGGAIRLVYASPSIQHNRIVQNSTKDGGTISGDTGSSPVINDNYIAYNDGRCIVSPGAFVILSNNTIANNSGSGVTVGNGSISITNNYIAFNKGAYNGGGIYLSSLGESLIARNIILGNDVRYSDPDGGEGGGIWCVGSVNVRDNVIAGNIASTGGGIYQFNTTHRVSGIIANNTIVSNRADSGGGVFSDDRYGTSLLENNIIVFNSSGVATTDMNTGPLSLFFNDVYGNSVANYVNVADLTGVNGNISLDPLFRDALHDDDRLNAASPCRDAGDNAAVVAGETDLDGGPRIQGPRVDMGAYEVR